MAAPKKVKVPIKNSGEIIICISVSSKHSLLLTNRSAVFASGLNEDQQLGVRDAGEKLTQFKEVVTLRDFGVENLLRVIARDFHSLAYSSDYIYMWGTNQGQMGLNGTIKAVSLPKQVKEINLVVLFRKKCYIRTIPDETATINTYRIC